MDKEYVLSIMREEFLQQTDEEKFIDLHDQIFWLRRTIEELRENITIQRQENDQLKAKLNYMTETSW